MPLFSTSLENQEQAAASGVCLYPVPGNLIKGGLVGDSFNRSSLTPTGAQTLYSSGGVGTEVISVSGGYLQMATGASIGDDAFVKTSELLIDRKFSIIGDSRSTTELDILFTLTDATSTEGFLGLAGVGDLTTIPTTAAHLGMYWDRSANANFILSSANNTIQSTTNTSQAISPIGLYRLNIYWTGLDSAIVSLYSAGTGDYGTLVKRHTVTDINSTLTFALHFFVQTETTASRGLWIDEWQVKTR